MPRKVPSFSSTLDAAVDVGIDVAVDVGEGVSTVCDASILVAKRM